MTTKTFKTILFASLIAALILPFNGMNTVIAEETDKIPTDKLIEKTADKWASKYNSSEEFDLQTSYISNYANKEFAEGSKNAYIQQQTIRLLNFETLIGQKLGSGGELVTLHIAKEKAAGTYGEDYHAVIAYHDWLSAKYEVPSTSEEIDNRILEIIGDKKYLTMSQEFADIKTDNILNGVVPHELIMENPDYWGKVVVVGSCNFTDACDFDEMQKVFDYPVMTEEEKTEIKKQKESLGETITTGFFEFFLQPVFAWTLQHYEITYGTMYAEPANTCAPGDCKIEDDLEGMSPQSGSATFTGDHGIGTHLDTFISHCGGDSTVVNENDLTATVISTYDDGAVGWGCATAGESFQVAQSPQATWLYSIAGDAESSKWVP